MIISQAVVINRAEKAAIEALSGAEVHNPYPVWSGAALLWKEAFERLLSESCYAE